MAKTICVREGKIVENKEIVYFKHFWEHILYKQMLEIEQRYFGKVSLATDLYDELRVKFEGKNVIAFADFSVATACSLNCKACTQWMPYLKNRKLFSAQEVHGWFENIFQWVDYIHIVSRRSISESRVRGYIGRYAYLSKRGEDRIYSPCYKWNGISR